MDQTDVYDDLWPERCAELHNVLLRNAMNNDPALLPEKTLLSRLFDIVPDFATRSSSGLSPLYRFFSLLETTPRPNGGVVALTPEMYQPDPESFFPEAASSEPGFLLLYCQNVQGSPMDGGLFLDLETFRVIWHAMPRPFPSPEHWVSLESALKRSVEKWNNEKYYWNPTIQSVAIRRWTQSDLSEALSAWDSLLTAIETRLPGGNAIHEYSAKRSEPLKEETMKDYRISRFARAFLSAAPRPGFAYIAPGITVFSAASLAQMYGSEPQDSYRRNQFIGGDNGESSYENEEEWASLVFPATAAVPTDISDGRSSGYDEIAIFDKPWGFGKFTVSRWAGLYVEQDTWTSDGVRLITPGGRSSVSEFRGRCPWGPSRSPRLAEVLLRWKSLVEDGVWSVGPEGIEAELVGWFDSHPSAAKLDWDEATT